MSRPKGYAAEEARAAFRRELEHCMLDAGIDSKKELALRASKDPRTIYRRFENIGIMDIDDLSALRSILCPNPIVLLKAIGYTQKEIDRAYQIAQTIGGKSL